MMVLLIKLVTLISTILEERQDMNPRTENAYPTIKEDVNNMIHCLIGGRWAMCASRCVHSDTADTHRGEFIRCLLQEQAVEKRGRTQEV